MTEEVLGCEEALEAIAELERKVASLEARYARMSLRLEATINVAARDAIAEMERRIRHALQAGAPT